MQNRQNEKYLQEDEIDLRELFKTLWSYKKFIFIFTGAITLLSIIYVFLKTPIYEVKALVEIGTYKIETKDKEGVSTTILNSLDTSNNLSKKLTTIFIDLRKNIKDKKYEITKIDIVKGMTNFVEISSEASTNDEAIKGLNEVIEYIKTEHNKLLNDIKEESDSKLKNISLNIQNIKDGKLINIDKKIELYNQNILSLEEQMKGISQTLENIDKLEPSFLALKLMEKRDISNAIVENKSNLYDLIENRKNLINVEISKLEDEKKSLETLFLPHNFKNSEIVGEILINDYPIKPKKSLIVAVAFVTGFILSIFLVFFMQFLKSFKKEEVK